MKKYIIYLFTDTMFFIFVYIFMFVLFARDSALMHKFIADLKKNKIQAKQLDVCKNILKNKHFFNLFPIFFFYFLIH